MEVSLVCYYFLVFHMRSYYFILFHINFLFSIFPVNRSQGDIPGPSIHGRNLDFSYKPYYLETSYFCLIICHVCLFMFFSSWTVKPL